MKKSAGIILFRFRDGVLEVFLVHPGGPFWKNKDEGAWSIPKGEFNDDEDPLAAAKREFKEEMNLDVEIGDHIYTTDFFQMSAFNPSHQIISIYYYVTPIEPIQAPLRLRPYEFDEQQLAVYQSAGEVETFRFIDWEQFGEDCMTLPIDKVVAGMLKLERKTS